MRVDDVQAVSLRTAHARRIAPAYAQKLRDLGVPVAEIDWSDADLNEDTAFHISLAATEFGLEHREDVFRYLCLRHSVGPKLHLLGRVTAHLGGSAGTTPAGMRVLSMLAETPASYWTKIRRQAGYEGSDFLDSGEA